jgi:copper transport protein
VRARLRLLAILLLAGLMPGLAWGHAELQSTEPEAGAVLAAPVPALVFHFNEPVRPIGGRLTGPDGATVPTRLEGEGTLVRLLLPAGLTQGSYVASLRVVSADAHPVVASLPFALGSETGLPPTRAEADNLAGIAALRWARDLVLLTGAGLALYMALVLASGSGAFAVLARGAAVSGGFGLVLILFEYAAAGARLTGTSDLLSRVLWQAAWHTSLLGASLCQATGAALLVVLPWAAPRRVGFLGPVAAVLVASGLALTGHTALDSAGINPFALALHVLGAAFWVGSLAAILRSSGTPETFTRDLPRFSALAMPAVAVLLIAGLVLAWRIGLAGGLSIQAPYQQWLALKVALVVPLLGLAILNRFRVVPAIMAGRARAVLNLRLSVGAEILLVAAILAVTAFLSHTQPGARPAAATEPHRLSLGADGIMAELEVAGRAAQARLSRADGGAFAPLGVRAEIELRDGALVGADLSPGSGGYAGTLPPLPPNAAKRYCLVVLVTDFERRRFCGAP